MIRITSQPVITASLAFLTKRPFKLIGAVKHVMKYSTVHPSYSLTECHDRYFDFSSKFAVDKVESVEIDLFHTQHLPQFLASVKSIQSFVDPASAKLFISTVYLISKINKHVELASTSQIDSWLWAEWKKCVVENIDSLSVPLLTNVLKTISYARLKKDNIVILAVDCLCEILPTSRLEDDAGALLSQIVVRLGKLYTFDLIERKTRLSLEEKVTLFLKLSMEQIDSFDIDSLSDLLHGCRLLERRLSPEFNAAFQRALRNTIPNASPVRLSELIYTVHMCHVLRLLPPSFNVKGFLEMWFDASTKSINDFEGFQLARSLSRIAKLTRWSRRNGPFFGAVNRRIALIGSKFNDRDLVDILGSYSKLAILPSEFSMNSLAFRVAKELPNFEDRALVHSIIQSLVNLGRQAIWVDLFDEANRRVTASDFNDQELLLKLMIQSLKCDALVDDEPKFLDFARSFHRIATCGNTDDLVDGPLIQPILRFEKWFGLMVFSDSDRRRAAIETLRRKPRVNLESYAVRQVASCLQRLNIPFEFTPFIDDFFGVVDFILSGRNIVVDVYSPNDYFLDTNCHITSRLKTNVLFKNALLRKCGFTVVGVPYYIVNDNLLYFLKANICSNSNSRAKRDS